MTKYSKRLLLLTAVLSVAVTGSMMKPTKVRAADARQLSFYHTHTRRSISVVYYENGDYVDSALDEINRFLKDFRTGDVTEINPQLLDLLHDVRNELGIGAANARTQAEAFVTLVEDAAFSRSST